MGNELAYLGRVTRPIRRAKKQIYEVKLENNITYDAMLTALAWEGSISSPKSVYIGVLWY